MIKYELIESNIEIDYKNRREIREGYTLCQDEQWPIVIESFKNAHEALEELKSYKTEIAEQRSYHGARYFDMTEYYVQENEYDEDGDWLSGGNVIEFSKIEIQLISEPEGEVIGTFDNYADAEDAYDDYVNETYYDEDGWEWNKEAYIW